MIAKEGFIFIAVALAIALALLVIAGGYGVPALIFPFYVGYFFRDPRRRIPAEENLILSPADGRVLSINEVEEARYLKKKVRKVSIFMSPFDVHINRVPYSGRVKQVFYNHGKYLAAFKEKASLDNEQNAVLMETDRGSEILFVQIAGWLARRIVCYLKGGEQVTRGDRYGLIRFGSRMDLYLPLDTEILVSVGERVKGGETVIGRFK